MNILRTHTLLLLLIATNCTHDCNVYITIFILHYQYHCTEAARRIIRSCCSWEYSQLHFSHSSDSWDVRERCTGEGGSGRTRQAVALRALRESGSTAHHWQACAELVMVPDPLPVPYRRE
jgi:hypothetical protein